ncbi:hypothetical protein Ade02nite_07500 [Paractinoplanes deccanensis]|uniref:DUF1461 domain-containing protein n=1 Tax=Paractinoplanes deccanensis TaxID=113561 RepID=A0ABQ3XWH3_9ACTN|nr:hypothetical protein [Actinoplanes deccanensis]GID72109.1 hypothetical protein Ade02nite_07500 [Actinoplanes deccanensis]
MRRLALRIAVALTAAALLAAVVAWAAWRVTAGDLPGDERMHALAGMVVQGSEKGTDITRAGHVSGSAYGDDGGGVLGWVLGIDEYGAGFAEMSFGEARTDLVAARARLEADGWRVGDDGSGGLTAANDDWRLTFRPSDGEGSDAELRVERAAPIAALVLTALAWIAGLVLGRRAAERFGNGLGLAALLFLAFNTFGTTACLVADALAVRGTGPFPLPWEISMRFGVRLFAVLGLVLAALAPLFPQTIAPAAARRGVNA